MFLSNGTDIHTSDMCVIEPNCPEKFLSYFVVFNSYLFFFYILLKNIHKKETELKLKSISRRRYH